MSAAVGLRGDFDAARLRAIAKQAKDGPQTRRLLTLASIYEGATRTEAAKIGGVTGQIVRDWVVKFRFFDVSSGLEQVSQGRGDHVDHGREGCDVAISASTGPGGLEQAVEPFETGIAV